MTDTTVSPVDWCEYRWLCETCPRESAYVDRADRPPTIPMRCTTCEDRMLLLVEPLEYADVCERLVSLVRRGGTCIEFRVGTALFIDVYRRSPSLHIWVCQRGLHFLPSRFWPFLTIQTDRIGASL